MKLTREYKILLEGRLDPILVAAPNGTYRATREWAIEMDAKCAADRALMGSEVDQREGPAWYRRGWIGRLLGWLRI